MKLLILLVCVSTMLDQIYMDPICATCHVQAQCRDDSCHCLLGYTGNGISSCEDDDECVNATQICGENANCTNTIGSYYCMCSEGFVSSDKTTFTTSDGTSCKDINECIRGDIIACGEHATCENTIGGYNCSCQEGYQPNTGKSHFKPDDGTHCQKPPNAKCHLDAVCLSENVNNTLTKILHITEPIALLQEIDRSTSGSVLPVDLVSYIEVLSVSYPSLVNDTESKRNTSTNIKINTFVNTVNNFVQKDKLSVWDKLLFDDRIKTITKLMHTVEQVTMDMSQNFKKTTQFEVNASDIALKVFAFDSHHMKHIHSHSYLEGDYLKIYPKRKDTSLSKGMVTVVFVRYENIGSLLAPSGSSEESDSSNYPLEPSEVVNSHVMAAAIKSNPSTLYQIDKIVFILEHLQRADEDTHTQCAFWRYQPETMNGNWATEGCERIYSNATHTSCKCNHLTHFAILMSSGRKLGVTHDNVLTRITQLGIIISLICLSMCIFTFFFFSEIQSTRTTIHKNLCCSLFLAELLFLTGINIDSNKLLCSVIAGLLHYFFLAAFAWMCIEGIHLYLIVVGVIYNKGFLHKNFYIFGYCSPAVVVGISAILGYRYYGTDNICWLSTENNFIWSFIGPACLIILVNLLAFGVIIYKVFRHTAMLKPEVSCYENVRSCARGALALLFLLGATWMFGVLHVLSGSVVTAYLFTISNAFQGMFIFIFLCVLSRKIQEEYYRLFKNVPCCFGFLR
ncbi:adhesion G protein-coupled receptor L4 [Ambystoma mexicanum]|uniref:adhesion G protein-coupled receptor L4 n=1 Tax=Ambystoma mexicanum TaxID=8296 RepID=UPI0037E8B3DC